MTRIKLKSRDRGPKPQPKIADMLGEVTKDNIRKLVRNLSADEAITLLSDWKMWQLPYQRMPEGYWRRWLLRMGRGTGKTHTGGATVNDIARDKASLGGGEIGIIGRTLSDARFTMVEGPSGILATAPMDFKPRWDPGVGNGLLTWPNGVRARLFSADKPESMRGANWGFVWADEPGHWKWEKKLWDEVIEPALRMGRAQAMLTSTPKKGIPLLRELEALSDTVVSKASTFDNPYLPKKTLEAYIEIYDGTSIGRQEMEGEYLDDVEGALWDTDMIDAYRLKTLPPDVRAVRTVIGVDPAVSANDDSDETGIIVAMRGDDNHGYVLQDRSGIYTPNKWGRATVAAYRRWKADAIIPEVNNGGDLVVSNIHVVDQYVNVRPVRATRGKITRAEPVVALYERGLIHHVGVFEGLEEQMVTWEPKESKDSPDRVDALVWALHELFLEDMNRAGPLRAYAA